MLEDLLGEDKFRDVVQKILKEKRGGLLKGSDLIEYCASACDEPLDWFVADWVNGNLPLDYAVTGVNQADGTVEISKIGGAAFPVVVEVDTEHGNKLRQRVDRSKIVNQLTFATTEVLKSVVIDPEGIYPDVDVSNNRWPK